ncbi:MAG: response regulator, partial [Desulfobacterales bacterium]
MKKKIGQALVVGAGISGIRSALDLAGFGYGVTLIDRAPHLGGILSKLDHQFPSNHCGMCRMLPMAEREAASQFCLRKGLYHDNIDILTGTELRSLSGEAGRFEVTLRQAPRGVDPELCTGCGACTAVCPVEVPDEFNGGLSQRKAIYLPVPHNIPNTYIIDAAACTGCGECARICPTQAIRFADDQRRAFRILVVDDELVVRDSLKEWLEVEGFSVEMAASGSEALERLAGSPAQLMLADIKMPGMDGVQLLEKAKAEHPDLAVLMMTAYATVETAVEAMKIGALDYLIKPFDLEVMLPKVVEVYQDWQAGQDRRLEVGAVVLCGGTDYFNPADDPRNPYGYGAHPGVVTGLEFERILSGSGPCRGQLRRPQDGRPLRRIAWLQCVGSRDLKTGANFCSSICCMASIKEALLAKEAGGEALQATIFHMDLRTFGKSFERYREQAASQQG